MATILESFDIDSPQHGKAFKIELAEGLDTLHLEFMEAQWAPAMKRQYNLAILQFFQLPLADQTQGKWYEISGKFAVQDHNWAWRTTLIAARDAHAAGSLITAAAPNERCT